MHTVSPVNFLQLFENPLRRARRRRRFRIIVGCIAALVFFVLSTTAVVSLRIITLAHDANDALTSGVHALEARAWDDAFDAFTQAVDSLARAERLTNVLAVYKAVPLVRRQIIAAEQTLHAVTRLAQASRRVAALARTIDGAAPDIGGRRFGELTPVERRKLMNALISAAPAVRSIIADVDLAMTSLERAPRTVLIPPLRDATTRL